MNVFPQTPWVFLYKLSNLSQAISPLGVNGHYPVIVPARDQVEEKHTQVTQQVIHAFCMMAQELKAVVICGGTGGLADKVAGSVQHADLITVIPANAEEQFAQTVRTALSTLTPFPRVDQFTASQEPISIHPEQKRQYILFETVAIRVHKMAIKTIKGKHFEACVNI